jgi:hypothetical protein
MEAVARRNPATVEELAEVTELRRWQVSELAAAFVAALVPHRGRRVSGETVVRGEEGSPYLE